jgi:uncharacterized protein (DUF2141 family)
MAQGPTGGLKDETSPKYQRSFPAPNAVNYTSNKIEVEFDEYIILDNPSKNLLVSPPQDKFPVAKGIGKKVTVELRDSLLPNTTYTFDFGNSIVDNNERNAIENYTFSFSTGPVLDSLSISGTVINANNLSPAEGIYVGVYSELSDSAFTSYKMEKVARTDSKGKFTIHNLPQKQYRVYALNDINNNFYFDQITEEIAVLNETITPQFEIKILRDTVYKDSVNIDTIITRNISRFYPDSLILRLFLEKDNRQYYIKSERNNKHQLTLYFRNPAKELPKITPLNFEAADWYIVEPSVTADTLFYWIKDSVVYNQDTLQFLIDYQKTDSIGMLIPSRDTIHVAVKKQQLTRREKEKKEEIIFTNLSSLPYSVEYYNNPALMWERPLLSFGKEHISLLVQEDTLWNEIDFEIQSDSLHNSRSYTLAGNWSPEKNYKIKIDSAAVTDIYGNHNNKIETIFKIRSKEEYANLIITVQNAPKEAFMELLDVNDKMVMQTQVINNKGTFRFVKPGEYFLRLISDRNSNGVWDTGNFSEKIEPEEVFYFTKKIRLRANWDVEENWNLTEVPLLLQKPLEIKIQKRPEKK